MERSSLLFLSILLTSIVMSGDDSATTALAKGLGLFVFPSENQDQKNQDADEMACFKWAMQQTNYDPLNPPEIQSEKVDQSADGIAAPTFLMKSPIVPCYSIMLRNMSRSSALRLQFYGSISN